MDFLSLWLHYECTYLVANTTVLHSAVCYNKRTRLPDDLSAYAMKPHRHSLCNWKVLIPISDRLKTEKESLCGFIQRHSQGQWKDRRWSGEEGGREGRGAEGEKEHIVGDGMRLWNQGDREPASSASVMS